MDNFNWTDDTWKVIDQFFKDNKYFVTKHQLDSYNEFLKSQMPTTIRQFNPIALSYEPKVEKGQDFNQYEINIYLGGSLSPDGKTIINDGKNIFIGKPVINEDGEQKNLYPNEARLKNLTYAVPIFTSVYVEYIEKPDLKSVPKKTIVDGRSFLDETKIFNHTDSDGANIDVPVINIGQIPVMLHTNACALRNMSSETLYQMGECPYDQGGYFIIDGKEKVIVAQEFQAPNRLIVSNHKHDVIKSSCSIRSESENTFEPARTTKIVMRQGAPFYKEPKIKEYLKNIVQHRERDLKIDVAIGSTSTTETFKIRNRDNHFMVYIPTFKKEIPVVVLFRALGVINDKTILEHIVYDTKHKQSQAICKLFEPSLRSYRKIHSKTQAFDYIRNCCIKPIYDIEEFTERDHKNLISNNKVLKQEAERKQKKYLANKEKKEHYENVYIVDALNRCFLPHCGENFNKKAFFLGYMLNQLASTALGLKKPTDRDSYFNKRVHISGLLIAALFRDLYFRFKNDIIYSANKLYSLDSNTHKKEIKNFINSGNVYRIFRSKIIDEGFLRAFKMSWNLKGTKTEDWQKGVVQDLNRLSYVGSTSHLRRIHTPIPKGAKIRAPHSLHLTTWGMFCPSESPDGGNIGIIKHLALTSTITFGCNSRNIRKCIKELGIIGLFEIGINYIYYLPKVFVNGDLVGVHRNPKKFVEKLRLLRRNAKINIYTSVNWNIQNNEIHINTDEGRCCRPLYIVKNNQLAITREHTSKIDNGEINWFNLIGGNNNYNEYSCDYICPVDGEDLSLNSGVVEYLDVNESDSSFIAMFDSDLKHDNVAYTHCEIHPSLILGIQASTIPFIENNQAPRNLFSGAQGKQAVGVYATNFYNRLDAESRNVLYYPQKPLVTNKLCDKLNINKLTYGENAIVAIACYTGYNQEDAVIVNKSALDRGLFRTLGFRTYEAREGKIQGTDSVEIFRVPDKEYTLGLKTKNLTNLDPKTGIVNAFDSENKSVKVHEGDILIGKVASTDKFAEDGTALYSDSSVYVRRREYGIIDRVYRNQDNEGYHYCKVRVRKIKIPDLGDKFASRHGQKGTIGIVLNQEDMPVTAEGITPDIIVNPHAIPSRMTVGQLIECIMGKACCGKGSIGDATAFTHINNESVSDLLESCNYERYGNETLYNGRTGEQLKCSIFIGPTYYQRLKHMSGDKYNSRGGNGPRTMLTRQPTSGRANGGGLRIGEMERDALLSHGVTSFLKESMVERSDGPSLDKKIPTTNICNKSGLIGIVNREKSIYREMGSDNNNDFSELFIPYSCKLLLQELQAMSIAPRIITEKSANNWAKFDLSKNDIDGVFKNDDASEIIDIPSDMVKFFTRRDIQNKFIKDTGIVNYSVNRDEKWIKLMGSISTIPIAVREIKEIISNKRSGIYPVTKSYFLPNNIVKELRSNKFKLLEEYKLTYKLEYINIGAKRFKDPSGLSNEKFVKINFKGQKNKINGFIEELDKKLNHFRNYEKLKNELAGKDLKPEPVVKVADKSVVDVKPSTSLYNPADWELNNYRKDGTLIDDNNIQYYYDKEQFKLIAQIGKYLHLKLLDDSTIDIWIDMSIYNPDNDSDKGVFIEKPREIEWYTIYEVMPESSFPLNRIMINDHYSQFIGK